MGKANSFLPSTYLLTQPAAILAGQPCLDRQLIALLLDVEHFVGDSQLFLGVLNGLW